MRVCVALLVVLALGACGRESATAPDATVLPDKVYQWKLVTTWPKNLPALGTAPERLAKEVELMSNGRLKIRVFGAGELVPAMEVFDAVSQGNAEMGHGAAYYWRGKLASAEFFATVPFGMNAQEMNGWLHYGGGLELWQEAYAPFNLIPLAAGNSGVQMAGWFNKEINSLEDLKGLKMRIPGLGGEVLKRAGGEPVTLPGGEIFTALQTGVIDATEWVGPYNDLALGLHTVAKYYYYPGWHEPGPTLEAIINKDAWESLPPDLQAMVKAAARTVNDDMLAEFTVRNASALKTLIYDHGVQVRRLPDDVIERLREVSAEVLAETGKVDPLTTRVYESYTAFAKSAREYHALSEQAYLEIRD